MLATLERPVTPQASRQAGFSTDFGSGLAGHHIEERSLSVSKVSAAQG
jgi:hypothetical protein